MFELRSFRLARVLPAEAFARPRRLIGPADEVLRALVQQGLTLRQIGDQVGMGAEGVRWRLRRAADIAG